MKQTPFFSIVIPTLNEKRALPLLLADLDRQTFKDFSVTIVDAHSHDGTSQIAKKHKNEAFYSLEIIGSTVRNVSIQRNQGAELSKGKWLLFIDADSRIDSKCFQQIAHELHLNPSIEVFTPRLKPATKSIEESFSVSVTNFSYEMGKMMGFPWCFGAFIGIKRQVFTRCGGFNSDLTYGEDVALIRQAVKAGARFKVLSKAKYIFSFRRQRRQGYFKTFSRYLELDFE